MATDASVGATTRTRFARRVRARLGACVALAVFAGTVVVVAPSTQVAAIPPVGTISTYADLPDISQSIAIRPNGDVLFLWNSGSSLISKMDPDGTHTLLTRGDSCPLQEPPQQGLTMCFGLTMAGGPDGSLYVTSNYDNKIWRVRPDNTIVAFAGVGGVNFGGFSGDGGPATSARLSRDLRGITVDDAGNVYFGDGQRVRKVDTNGIITTIAGGGTENPGDGGPATDAALGRAVGIAVDSTGNVYFAEFARYRLRKVDTSGIITTIAGTGVNAHSGDGGPAAAAELYNPGSLTFDDAGNLLLGSSGTRIRAIDPDGIIDTVAGTGVAGYSGDGGPATQADLQGGGLVFHPDGDLYMEQWRAKIRRITWHGDLAGAVTSGGQPVEGVVVSLLRDWPSWSPVGSTLTGADGTYRFDQLDAGVYRVRFFDPDAQHPRVWHGGGTYRAGTPVNVAVGDEPTVDASLSATVVELTGQVTDNPTGDPLAGVHVMVFTNEGYVGAVNTNAAGHYRFKDLAPGTYWVRFVEPANARSRWSAWYPGVVQFSKAQTITLTAPTTTIGAALFPRPT